MSPFFFNNFFVICNAPEAYESYGINFLNSSFFSGIEWIITILLVLKVFTLIFLITRIINANVISFSLSFICGQLIFISLLCNKESLLLTVFIKVLILLFFMLVFKVFTLFCDERKIFKLNEHFDCGFKFLRTNWFSAICISFLFFFFLESFQIFLDFLCRANEMAKNRRAEEIKSLEAQISKLKEENSKISLGTEETNLSTQHGFYSSIACVFTIFLLFLVITGDLPRPRGK